MSWPAIVLYTSLAAGDVASTEWGQRRGAWEGNSLLQNKTVMYSVKASEPVVLSWIESKVPKRRRKLFRIGATIAGGVVIGLNIESGIRAGRANRRR